jgi:hypothetical protein
VVIRLVLVRLPRLLADVVREAFAGVAELTVETVEGGGRELEEEVAAARPTVLITGVDSPGEAEETEGLVAAHHEIVVLGLTPDARRSWLYELRPVARPLGELSPELLRRTVLDAVRSKTP